MTNSDEAVGKDVQKEPANELESREPDKPVGARLVIVPGTEGDGLTIEGKNALVGDGGSVGVLTEVAIDVLGAMEGRLGVSVPFNSSQVPEESLEGVRVPELLGPFREEQFVLAESFLDAV